MEATAWLAETLSTDYGLSLTASLEQIGGFKNRSVVLVRSDQGPRVAKIFQGAEVNDRLRASFGLMTRLYHRGCPHVPALYPALDGRLSVEQDGALIYLMEHIPTVPSSTPATWSALGRAAGLINRIRDEPVPFAIPVQAALQEIDGRAVELPYGGAVRDLTVQLGELLESQPVGLIHAEINPANASLRADGSAVLLDWDEAGTGAVALEQGYPLITQFIEVRTHRFWHANARAFYRGYRSIYPDPLDPQVVFAAALFHALRYMVFYETDLRWARIQYALAHRGLLLSSLAG